ncbi:MAG: DUF1836 domain-containing protein [Lachnospiraceae bacterium]|jgi:hypothetical protein|nr:DUF1836 domain-containing protein [Lachnospiraceae bacterium]
MWYDKGDNDFCSGNKTDEASVTNEQEQWLEEIIKNLSTLKYIRLEEIPNLGLYMEQVTSFMDKKLMKSPRGQEEDKVLTKTMINNYTKNQLIPPPEGKKYSRDHILLLIFIYYYKGVLSIQDIQTLLTPLKEDFFHIDVDEMVKKVNDGYQSLDKKEASILDLGDIYQEIFELEREQMKVLKADIIEKFMISQKAFTDATAEDEEFLRLFAFISMLSFDVYLKRRLIEQMIEQMRRMGKSDE